MGLSSTDGRVLQNNLYDDPFIEVRSEVLDSGVVFALGILPAVFTVSIWNASPASGSSSNFEYANTADHDAKPFPAQALCATIQACISARCCVAYQSHAGTRQLEKLCSTVC